VNKSKITTGLLIAAGLASHVYVAQAQVNPYLIDQRGEVARSGTGLCWRTGYWTPALAAQFPKEGCACDKDLLPKEVCEPVAPKAAPAPTPAPAPAAQPAAPKPIMLSAKSLFDFDKAVLKPEAQAILDKEVLGRLKELETIDAVIISGHTDRLGSAQHNQKLSERRAEAVKAYLISKGVDQSKIETFGFGKTQPVTDVKCDDKLPRKQLIACLEPHRRVIVEIKGKGKGQ